MPNPASRLIWAGTTDSREELSLPIKGKEGVVIARLLADDGDKIVGWVYLWSTADLGIRWSGSDRAPSFIKPQISAELLSEASAAGSVDVVEFLKALPPMPTLSED